MGPFIRVTIMMMMVIIMTAMIMMVRTNHRGPRINGTLQAFNQRHLIDTNWRSANHLVVKNKMVKMTSWVDLDWRSPPKSL